MKEGFSRSKQTRQRLTAAKVLDCQNERNKTLVLVIITFGYQYQSVSIFHRDVNERGFL